MSTTREIKRRIKSIQNTKKITKAMELVSASKMRKSVSKLLSTRPYADIAWNVILNLTQNNKDIDHPLVQSNTDAQKYALVLITSNRGLCGGFNSNMIKKAKAFSSYLSEEKNAQLDIIALGRKGAHAFSRSEKSLVADFEKSDIATGISEIYATSHFIIEEYLKKEYKKVFVGYMNYHSALSQTARIIQLLPISLDEIDEFLGFTDREVRTAEEFSEVEYIVEPNYQEVVNDLLPKIVDIRLYQALVEAEASEHSARMVAMKSAHDAAGDMIKSLKLAYNRARQASITQEISEISAGKASLDQ